MQRKLFLKRVSVCAAALLLGRVAIAAPFLPGDLLVSRATGGTVDASGGGGSVGAITTSTALGGSGLAASVFIDEYTPAGVLVQSLQLPNVQRTSGTGNYALVFSGTQNNEGAITLSGDGRYFVVAGYNQTAGVAGTNASTSATVQRVVGLIDQSGNVNSTTALTDVASGQSIRSAYSTNGTDIWVGGSSGTAPSGGVHYTTVGSTTSTQLTAGATNQRILNGYSGQLYLSNNSSTATARGINTVGTGFPTAGGPALAITQLPGFSAVTTPTPSNEIANDYWFKDATTLYITDERNGTAADNNNGINGGVQKWLFVDTNADTTPDTWVFQYNVPFGMQAGPTTGGNVGGAGLAGTIDPITGNAILFATSFDGTGANSNRLFRLIDDGTASGFAASLTTLATSPTINGFATAFRGVEIVPVPEQASLALLLAAGALALRRRG